MNRMTNTKSLLSGLKVPVVVILLMSLAGCVGGPREVREGDKDSAGKFNGQWVANVKKGPDTQIVQNWRLKCRDRSGQYSFNVKDGQISTRVNWNDGAKEYSSFISSEGKFLLKFPSRIMISSSTTATQVKGKEEMIVMFKGSLSGEAGKGSLVVGVPSWGNAGCSSRASYQKQ